MIQPKILLLITAVLFSGFASADGSRGRRILMNMPADTVQHPSWCFQAAIYEVNIRQYTPEGDFRSFEKHLPRLKAMGVKILWLMPVQPIGRVNRKGLLGSPYSIQDYYRINPEFGTMADFRRLIKTAHRMGLKVILDWVADHTSWDNVWTVAHPDYYVRDSEGRFTPPVKDWQDVIRLNYDNPDLRTAMTAAMKWWVKETGIDGFRCDVADMVPLSFWKKTRAALDSIKPVFLLGEMEKPEYHEAFDASYTWTAFHLMNEVAQGKKSPADLEVLLRRNDSIFPPGALRMYFTTNHDENSWNGTEYENMGKAAAAFAVMTFTLPGIPLIYGGQEAANRKRLRFYDKDTILWNGYPLEGFYHGLLRLKNDNPALAAGNRASLTWTGTSAGPSVLGYLRRSGHSAVLVLLNLSNLPQHFRLAGPLPAGSFENIFDRSNHDFSSAPQLELPPWGYWVGERIKPVEN